MKDYQTMSGPGLAAAPCSGLNFSGTYYPAHHENAADWLRFTETEYYHRARSIMCKTMGEGDVENILAHIWEMGWSQGKASNE